MIVGIGIDIIEVSRVGAAVERENGFKERIFSSNEIAFCEERKERGQHFAARFAAKEAFLKATGRGFGLSHHLNQVEIIHEKEGNPAIRLHGSFKEMADREGWLSIKVSISHIKETACAVVTIEK